MSWFARSNDEREKLSLVLPKWPRTSCHGTLATERDEKRNAITKRGAGSICMSRGTVPIGGKQLEKSSNKSELLKRPSHTRSLCLFPLVANERWKQSRLEGKETISDDRTSCVCCACVRVCVGSWYRKSTIAEEPLRVFIFFSFSLSEFIYIQYSISRVIGVDLVDFTLERKLEEIPTGYEYKSTTSDIMQNW